MPLNSLYTVNSDEVEKSHARYIQEASWQMKMQEAANKEIPYPYREFNMLDAISKHIDRKHEEILGIYNRGIVIDGEVIKD
jgi:hypothetical protein